MTFKLFFRALGWLGILGAMVAEDFVGPDTAFQCLLLAVVNFAIYSELSAAELETKTHLLKETQKLMLDIIHVLRLRVGLGPSRGDEVIREKAENDE